MRGSSLSGAVTLLCHEGHMCCMLPYWSEGNTATESVWFTCPFKGLHLLSGPPPLHQRLGVKGSGAHGKLHLWEHFKDAGDS